MNLVRYESELCVWVCECACVSLVRCESELCVYEIRGNCQ